MDTNKRPAEIQLDRETTESETSFRENDTNDGSWGRAPDEVLSQRRILKVPHQDKSSELPSATTSTAGGFAAYAKVNAFAAAAAMGPPSAMRASPKSPKPNPFSSPSPTPNPFMSYVSKGNNYWSKMATSASGTTKSESGSNPENGFAALAATSAAFNSSAKPSFTGAFNSSSKTDNGCLSDNGVACNKPLFASSSNSASSPTKSSLHQKLQSSDSINDKKPQEEIDKKLATQSDSEDNEEELDGDEEDHFLPPSAPASPSSSPTTMGSGFSSSSNSTDNGEKGEKCLLQCRAKLFRLSRRCVEEGSNAGSFAVSSRENSEDKPAVLEWVEIGTGPVRVLAPTAEPDEKDSSSQRSRVVMRRESQAGGVGTKLILNILLDANVTVARQAEKACRITCIIAEPAPSLSVVHTPLPIGTGNDSAKGDLSAATADATATSSVSSSSACAALAASNASSLEKQSERLTEETMVPVTYLFKTKHVQETDDFISIVNSRIPKAEIRGASEEKNT